MTTTTLHYVEFCGNNLGIWDKAWFATKEEAKAEFKRLKEEEGYSPGRDDGSWGSLLKPAKVEVELNPKGLLDFAQTYAVDQSG